jgi:hypothetical protein
MMSKRTVSMACVALCMMLCMSCQQAAPKKTAWHPDTIKALHVSGSKYSVTVSPPDPDSPGVPGFYSLGPPDTPGGDCTKTMKFIWNADQN